MPLGRGVRLPITVLFADIRGFTSLAERHEPQDVVRFLNEYIGIATPILLKHDGCIDKLLGDSIMAVFGAPIVQPDHVGQAVAAAVELQDALAGIQTLGGSLRVGVGLHTGEAVVANVGDIHVRDFTAIGDTVNVASRVQELAKPGEVLATAQVYESVARDYPQAPSWQAQLDGRSQPVTVYRLRAG
ncbi:MAG: adenylate/guanylate cyclase domain-containing protein [Chloroflexi bacterium]|nr:adenylate/guanylate cyclase domain-containing protein [Chloroflexota bacterium]